MKESSSVMNTFAAVVEEFGPAVFRLSLALTGNEEVANDIYQQTFLLLLEKKPRFSHRAQLNVWLLRSARKLAATEMRRFDNSKTVPITETAVPAATQEHSFEFLDLMSVLSEKYREVTVLFYIEDMTVYAREHQHMRTLKESGLVLVKEGLTTPEELMKISYE